MNLKLANMLRLLKAALLYVIIIWGEENAKQQLGGKILWTKKNLWFYEMRQEEA